MEGDFLCFYYTRACVKGCHKARIMLRMGSNRRQS